MTIYLVHGFRWPRTSVRVHIILNNLDDAAPEYIVGPKTTRALLENLHELYPDIMESLPDLRFVEQYNPGDTTSTALSQPFAYVVDQIQTSGHSLSLDITDTIARADRVPQREALEDLKNTLAPDERIGWFVVYNGDEMRQGEALNKSSKDLMRRRYRRRFRQLHARYQEQLATQT